MAQPTTSPQDSATDDDASSGCAPTCCRQPPTVTGAEVMVGGRTAMLSDLSERITSRLPAFILAVVALSFLLLMVVFRSVLVPLKAAIMNLLSIGAAYGVIVAVFQWGWGKGLIGLDSTVPVNPFVPMIMFAILFGLSMDYEVFLLSRVREEFQRTGDSHRSVVDGLAQHGPGDHLGRADHDQRVPRLRDRRRRDRQDVRPRPGDGRVHRRHARPDGARAVDDEPARLRQLVAAPLARPDPARTWTSKAATSRRRRSPMPSSSSCSRPARRPGGA